MISFMDAVNITGTRMGCHTFFFTSPLAMAGEENGSGQTDERRKNI
jgi:hypothetical protein